VNGLRLKEMTLRLRSLLPVILALWSVPAEAQNVPAEAWVCAYPSGDPSPAFNNYTIDGDTLVEEGGSSSTMAKVPLRVPLKYTILDNNEMALVAAWPYHVGAIVVVIDKRTGEYRQTAVDLIKEPGATTYGRCTSDNVASTWQSQPSIRVRSLSMPCGRLKSASDIVDRSRGRAGLGAGSLAL
jgi:hypothetical protein